MNGRSFTVIQPSPSPVIRPFPPSVNPAKAGTRENHRVESAANSRSIACPKTGIRSSSIYETAETVETFLGYV